MHTGAQTYGERSQNRLPDARRRRRAPRGTPAEYGHVAASGQQIDGQASRPASRAWLHAGVANHVANWSIALMVLFFEFPQKLSASDVSPDVVRKELVQRLSRVHSWELSLTVQQFPNGLPDSFRDRGFITTPLHFRRIWSDGSGERCDIDQPERPQRGTISLEYDGEVARELTRLPDGTMTKVIVREFSTAIPAGTRVETHDIPGRPPRVSIAGGDAGMAVLLARQQETLDEAIRVRDEQLATTGIAAVARRPHGRVGEYLLITAFLCLLAATISWWYGRRRNSAARD